eukprot:gene14808-16980_t
MTTTVLRSAALKAGLGKHLQSELYPAHLRQFYAINSGLRKEGISAPQEISLANTKRLYEIIGSPLDEIPTLHVGGTNGKGTTSFKLSEVLKANGVRTGLFVSPHLASFRERIQVNSELLPEESFVSNLQTLLGACAEHKIPATEFELTFLMAALHFKQTNCEAVVLEVGCGGEYDATNVFNTALSIICSVSLDHTRILGSTVEVIGRNKAGIFRKNTPALVGPGVPLSEMQDVAQQRGTPLYTYDSAYEEFKPTLWKHNIDLGCNDASQGITLSPVVDTDALNANIALLGLHLLCKHHPHSFPALSLSSEITRAALDTRPPCRWEEHTYTVQNSASKVSAGMASGDNQITSNNDQQNRLSDEKTVHKEVPVQVVLDMGHNPAAMGALARRIAHKFQGRNVRVVYAMSRDKDVRTCLKNVLAVVPSSHVHFVQSKNFRAISREELCELFRDETGEEMSDLVAPRADIQNTLRIVAQRLAEEGPDGVLVVCGTGYIMPQARAFVGIDEPRDELDLHRDGL